MGRGDPPVSVVMTQGFDGRFALAGDGKCSDVLGGDIKELLGLGRLLDDVPLDQAGDPVRGQEACEHNDEG